MNRTNLDIITFLTDLPSQISLARRQLFNDNLNVLEHWCMRLEDLINILDVLQRRFTESGAPGPIITDINLLLGEIFSLQSDFNNVLRQNEFANAVPNFQQPLSFNEDRDRNTTGRPRKNLTNEEIQTLFELHRNWKVVASIIGVSEKTLYRRRNEAGLSNEGRSGPRLTYTNISQEDLCAVVKDVLNTLPNAGETYVIGACRSRGIFAQRRRIREAIKEVDPISRALRRTVSILRRVYCVPGPNALW